MKNRKIQDNPLMKFGITLGVSMLIFALAAVIFAAAAVSSDDPTKNIRLFSLLSLVISAVASGIFTTRFTKDGGIKLCLASSSAFMLILLLVSVIVNSGKIPPSAFMNYGCYIGVYCLAGHLGRPRNAKRKRR